MRHPNVTVPLVLASALLAQGSPRDRVLEVLDRVCAECHDASSHKGGFDLDAARAGEPVAFLTALSRARDQVHGSVMPPKDEDPLPDAVRRRFLDDCAAVLRDEVPRLPIRPLRVTIRRLSRAEWEFAVLDLFGSRSEAAADFPADDLGYGFDHIGDALSFSTLHFEKYLAAAREVAASVYDDEDSSRPPRQRFEAEAMELVAGPGFANDGDVAGLYTNATLAVDFDCRRDGTHRLAVSAGATAAGDEPARMVVRLDGRELAAIEVRQKELREESITLPIGRGRHRLEVAFVNDFWDPDHADPERRDRNLRIDFVDVVGPLEPMVRPPQQQWVPRGAKQSFAEVARIVGERVHRGHADAQRDQSLAALAERSVRGGASRDEALRELLVAALCSPRFLFRIEPESRAAAKGAKDGAVAVPPLALAVRLSYLVWSSGPDEVLVARAKDGSLATDAGLLRELDRLLQDPRAERLATNFAAQWLELRALDVRTPDPSRFPGFDAELRRSMRRETELLFDTVRKEGLDVRSLLDAPFTHLDATLARFYGVAGEFDASFRRVALEGDVRVRRGLLGHASWLAVTSNPTRTSPVKRGKWILDNLLDQSPPPPPPGNAIFADEGAAADPRNLREQLAAHRERAACAGCHVRMDAFGLALERYDAVGRVRHGENGVDVDDSAELPSGARLAGLGGLRDLLRDDPAFPRTLLRKLFVHGVGREPSPAERLALDLEVERRMLLSTLTIRELLAIVVLQPGFRLREMPT